jgi:hypothetical protein
MGTRESQSDAQTSANNQSNYKALKLTNQEQEDENFPKNLKHTRRDFSLLRTYFDDPNGQKIASGAANLPSKFEQNPTVNESGIGVLVGLLCGIRDFLSLFFSLFLIVVLSQNLLTLTTLI